MNITARKHKGVSINHAHTVLRKHYDLGRSLTETEVLAEIDNLVRKHEKKSLDDISGYLYAALFRGIDHEQSQV
jgi:protein-disulfide isomerase-like protein with CxxC motif